MVRSRRESHHSDGITDQKSLQRTSATKSANSGLVQRSKNFIVIRPLRQRAIKSCFGKWSGVQQLAHVEKVAGGSTIEPTDHQHR
jgi:hypothetical protein